MFYFDEPDDDYSSLDALARRASCKMRLTRKIGDEFRVVYTCKIERPDYERILGWPEHDVFIMRATSTLDGEILAVDVSPKGEYAEMTWGRIVDSMDDEGDSFVRMTFGSIFEYAKRRGCLNYVGIVIEANPKKCVYVA